MNDDQIGRVVHYYDKIGVAVVKLNKSLSVGSKVKFEKGENSFEQVIESMQLDHQPVNTGSAGDEVAIKVAQKAAEGALLLAV